MFWVAKSFNQDLSKWDVSRVTNMCGMFAGAESFNQDLSKWDVSRVTNMLAMFTDAQCFNQDLSAWDVSRVTDMDFMFARAKAFNRELCGVAWVNSKSTKNDMFINSPGSIAYTTCTTDNGEGEGYGYLAWGSSAQVTSGFKPCPNHTITLIPLITFTLTRTTTSPHLTSLSP